MIAHYQNPILPGSHVAREGKTMTTPSPIMRRKTKGSEPKTISFMVTPGIAPFKTNRLSPTGGVIIPISTLIVTMIPNQTGSNPSLVMMGNRIGREMTRIAMGSRRQPIMTKTILMMIITVHLDTSNEVINSVTYWGIVKVDKRNANVLPPRTKNMIIAVTAALRTTAP